MYSDKALAWFRTPLANGLDQTLLRETAFSAGFMMDPRDESGRKTRAIYGPSMTAFGHPAREAAWPLPTRRRESGLPT